MNKTYLASTFIGAFVILITLFDQGVKLPVFPQQNISHDTQLQMAPDFTFTDLKGTEHRLSDYRGKIVVLNFWGTWCPICVREFPAMLRAVDRYRDKIVLIALASDDDAAIVERFFKKLPFDVAKVLSRSSAIVGLDAKRTITRDFYGTIVYPETFFIDPDGYIIHKMAGEVPWDQFELTRPFWDISPK
jgi:thiol-disulfide isomerase/thioredoxin